MKSSKLNRANKDLQCENLSSLMWTHRDTVSHSMTIKLLHHILFLLLIYQVTVFNVAF